MTNNTLTNLVAIVNNQVVVSSRQVAESFEKRHDKLTFEIERMYSDYIQKVDAPKMVDTPLFIENTYIHPQNKQEYKEYLMTRDGFSFLIMGFTGEKAFQWKCRYIQAFNEMERQLANKIPQTYLEALKALVITEEAKLEAERARQIAETKVIQLAPKAKKYDEVISTAKTFSISEISAILGLGYGNKLHTLLVQEGWLDKEHRGAYTVGDMAPDNTFQVALNNYRGHRAEQVRVTTSGFTKIQALLKLRSQF